MTVLQHAPFVQSVLGPVAPDTLGATLMHEHILCDLRMPANRNANAKPFEITLANRFETDYRPRKHPETYWLNDPEMMCSEITLFKQAGGGTIVDLTTGGVEPKPLALADIARATGVTIVLGAGYYADACVPDTVKTMSVEAFADLFTAQIQTGCWGTDVRCGIIGEIGCSWPMTPFEHRLLLASAVTQTRTGATINVHPGRHPQAPHEIIDILDAAGADLSRVVISHMDRTYPDGEGIKELAQRGCVVEWDFFGIETSNYWFGVTDLPNDWMRIRQIAKLFDAGLGDRVAVSHDICTRTRFAAHGGHGYGHMLRNVVPLMRDRGFGDSEIETLLISTPRRLLTLQG